MPCYFKNHDATVRYTTFLTAYTPCVLEYKAVLLLVKEHHGAHHGVFGLSEDCEKFAKSKVSAAALSFL